MLVIIAKANRKVVIGLYDSEVLTVSDASANVSVAAGHAAL